MRLDKLLLVILLLEAVTCGGVFTFRYVMDFADGVTWHSLYQEEKVLAEFYQAKVECAMKRNGCSKRKVEEAIIGQDADTARHLGRPPLARP